MPSISTLFPHSWLSPHVTLYEWDASIYLVEYILYTFLRFWVSPPEFLAAQTQSLPRTVHREPASNVNFLCWQALVDMNLTVILGGSDCALPTLGMIIHLGYVSCRNVVSYVSTPSYPFSAFPFPPFPSARCGVTWTLHSEASI